MDLPEKIKYFTDNYNDYTKEELYMEYVDVVTRLLEELISVRSYEEIIDYLSPEDGDQIIKDDAVFFSEITEPKNKIDTPQEYIHHLLSVIENYNK